MPVTTSVYIEAVKLDESKDSPVGFFTLAFRQATARPLQIIGFLISRGFSDARAVSVHPNIL